MFEELGYFLDYYYNGKYYGSKQIDEKDREEFGYVGRRKHISLKPIKFKNKRIPANVEYITELNKLNGKIKR